MTIKSFVPVSENYAVLATRKSVFAGPCYDQHEGGHSFFWVLVDGGSGDYIELIDVDVDGNQRICDHKLVVARKPCPYCNQRMEPAYDSKHIPDFWQECPTCGFVYDMRCHDDVE